MGISEPIVRIRGIGVPSIGLFAPTYTVDVQKRNRGWSAGKGAGRDTSAPESLPDDL